MKRKMLLVGSLLVGLTLFIGGCHYRTSDSYRYRGYSGYSGYSGYGGRHDAYREGWRDGRSYERRRDAAYDRRDYYYPGYRWGRW
jgi:hypothetical protein